MGCDEKNEKFYCTEITTPAFDTIINSFKIGKFEVTNAEYAAFLNSYGQNSVKSGEYKGQIMIDTDSVTGIIKNGSVWKAVKDKEEFPAVNISWYGANEFCKFYGGRLPTNAEWEYAAKGGQNYTDYYEYSGSDSINNEVAWFVMNSNHNTHRVGTKEPNQLGIYDMSSNVSEWCSDWHISYPRCIKPFDYSGKYRILRNGYFSSWASFCNNTTRAPYSPDFRTLATGFRFAQNVD